MVTSARDSRETLVRLVEQSNKRLADIGAMRETLEDEDRLAQRLGLAIDIEGATSDMQAIDANIAAYRAIAVRFDPRFGGVQEQAAPVTVSVGVAALHGARRSTPAELISAADKAMYEAKHGGRDQVRRQPAVAACDDAPVAA